VDELVAKVADARNVKKFLNRMLGMAVHQQHLLFEYFHRLCEHEVKKAKNDGTFDTGTFKVSHATSSLPRHMTRHAHVQGVSCHVPDMPCYITATSLTRHLSARASHPTSSQLKGRSLIANEATRRVVWHAPGRGGGSSEPVRPYIVALRQ